MWFHLWDPLGGLGKKHTSHHHFFFDGKFGDAAFFRAEAAGHVGDIG